MKKAEARFHFLNERQLMSPQKALDLNSQILKRFKTLDFIGIKTVHLFLPILSKKEINTYLLANWLREMHPEIKLVLSRSNVQNHTLSHFIWEKETPLAENSWGIIEPQSGEEIGATELDMVLIPLLAFDKSGQRVGYGKGFYDRFLSECRPDAQKIGLSYFEPIEKIEDADALDTPLDSCITVNKTWKF